MIIIAAKSKVMVRKRGDYYQWSFEIEPITEIIEKDGMQIAKKKRQRQYGSEKYKTEKEAREAGEKAYAECLVYGGIVKTEIKTVADLVVEYLKHQKRQDRAYNTQRSKKSALKNLIIIPIGTIKLVDLNQGHCDKVVKLIKDKKIKSKSKETYLTYCRNLFTFAVQHGYIKTNPFLDYRISEPDDRKKDCVLSDDQLNLIFDKYKDDATIFTAITIARHTGMRIGEICGLRWNDIDLQKRRLKIGYQVERRSKKEGFYLQPPKNKSVRQIYINKTLADFLQKLQAESNRKTYDLDDNNKIIAGNKFSFVLTSKDGSFVDRHVMEGLKNSYVKMGYPYFRYHQFRHTACTYLINNGIDTRFVSERLGHKKLSTTMDIYNHLTNDVRSEEENKLDNIL